MKTVWEKYNEQQMEAVKEFNQGYKKYTIINVCGVILFFYITTRLLNLGPILTGILEMTSGVAKTTNPFLVQFFVTFGGLSVAMQQQIFMQNFQIKFQTYLVYKITHALLACALLAICLLFLN